MLKPLKNGITWTMLMAVMVFFHGHLLAQTHPLVESGGQKVPKSLLTVISIHLKNVPFEKALAALAKKGNFKLSYNRSRIPVHKKVSVKMEDVQALKVLIHLMEKTGTKLVITRKGQLAIVPNKKRQKQPTSMRKGNIRGQVFDGETREVLPGANIYVFGKRMGASSGPDGRFTIQDVPAGIHSLQFSYVGYASKILANINITENQVPDVTVSLTPEAFALKSVTVTPGRFSIMGKGPSVRQTLTREELEAVPFGEDVYRAINRLPGISSSDFSAKFSVRGGENEQVLVLVDGLELYEPFHLKDIDGGILSIIDVAAVEGIDLLTGGFPAEYGDRMSGVFNIRSTRPRTGKKKTSLGISFMNARMMSEGTFHEERGAWLVSARRGYLDLILDLVGEKDPPQPVYYDVLGKIEYHLNAKQVFSANFLHARDRLNYVEDDQDEDNTGYGNTYTWLTLKSIPNSRLFVKSVASYGRLTHYRNGTGYTDDLTEINFMVRDKRDVDIFGFRQDWNLDLSDRWYLKWGLDLKGLASRYDYMNAHPRTISVEPFSVRFDTTQTYMDPSGTKLGAYLSSRFQLLQPLTAEVGLRYDYNSYTGDKLSSPRFNLVYALGKQTFLRGGWGYFYQSQGIHEVRVGDRADRFFPAELAKHWVAGFEHTFRNGINLRLEGYYKSLSRLRPDYRNWSNSIEIFPETQRDRFTLEFDGAASKGVEGYLKYDRGGKFTWWASYALSRAEENIRSLHFLGREYPGGKEAYPGERDQRHTVYLDTNYRPNRKWHLNLSWQFHTGWPYTEMVLRSTQTPGGLQYYSTYKDFNRAKHPAFHRMDLRINRHFDLSKGRVSAFLTLINVYNHSNERNIKYNWQLDSPSEQPYLKEVKENWFKLLPSVGISWSWDH